jgi:hypothetical protein
MIGSGGGVRIEVSLMIGSGGVRIEVSLMIGDQISDFCHQQLLRKV